jgi:hypothetical protein
MQSSSGVAGTAAELDDTQRQLEEGNAAIIAEHVEVVELLARDAMCPAAVGQVGLRL